MERDTTTVIRAIVTHLQSEGATLATAESCTGGRIASLLTSVAGASEWYQGGVVAYTRKAKIEVLGVPETELKDGLVTARCAGAMARMASLRLGADYGISTTGVCGPTSSEGVPPCGVYLGVYHRSMGVATTFYHHIDRGRIENIESVAKVALQLFLEWIEKGGKR